jgi:hypothetical protein
VILRTFIGWCILASWALLLNCSVKGTVVDIGGNKTMVKGIKLSPHPEILVLDGASTRSLGIRRIDKLVIKSDRSRICEGRLFYGAEIDFRETDDPYGNENRKPNTFVGVGGYLTGTSRAGTYRIPLDQITEVEFVYEQ